MSYKIVIKTFALITIFSFAFSSCKIYYSTGSINSKLKVSIDNINNNCTSVTDKINEMHKQYLSLDCKTDTKPFQTAKQQLEKTNTLVSQMNTLQKSLNTEYANYNDYSRGKDKIESGSPEWKKFKVTKKKMKSGVKELQSVGNKAVKNATLFNNYVNEMIAPTVQFCDLAMYTTKFDEIITTLNKNEQDLNDNLKNYEAQVLKMTTQYNNAFPDKCQELTADLNSIISSKDRFQNIKQMVQDAINEFKQKTSGKQKIYSCSSEWTIVTNAESKVTVQQGELTNLQQNIQGLAAHMQQVVSTMQ
jgi:hypothetical protein